MKQLKTFRITSSFIEKLHIPAEANMKYLNEQDIEIARQKVEIQLLDFFKSGVKVTIEEIDVPHLEFDRNLFEEPNIKLLCYIGFSYPRYFKGQKIYYGCWYLYEFGGWGENINRYYNQNGEFDRTEKI